MSTIIFGDECLVSARRRDMLLESIGRIPHDGQVLRAFFSVVAFAALRPSEALALRVRDIQATEGGSGVLMVASRGRGIQGGEAVRGAVRRVPLGVRLARVLKEEVARRGLGSCDTVFVRDDGRPLTAAMYRRAWEGAWEAARLESHETGLRLDGGVSVLRDACIADWMKAGPLTAGQLVAIAEIVGVSAAYLASRFAYCLQVSAEIDFSRLEAAFELPDGTLRACLR